MNTYEQMVCDLADKVEARIRGWRPGDKRDTAQEVWLVCRGRSAKVARDVECEVMVRRQQRQAVSG